MKTKIAFFDLEGTLIEKTSWETLRNKFGVTSEQDKEFQKLFDKGKITHKEWRNYLADIWRKNKTTKQQFVCILKQFKLKKGVKELISSLRKKGYEIAIISGALDLLVELVAKELGIKIFKTTCYFIFDKNNIIKEIKTPKGWQGEAKPVFIEEIAKKLNANLDDCIAIGGDDLNDLWMFKKLKSFAVNPHLEEIKKTTTYSVKNLKEVLKYI